MAKRCAALLGKSESRTEFTKEKYRGDGSRWDPLKVRHEGMGSSLGFPA